MLSSAAHVVISHLLLELFGKDKISKYTAQLHKSSRNCDKVGELEIYTKTFFGRRSRAKCAMRNYISNL